MIQRALQNIEREIMLERILSIRRLASVNSPYPPTYWKNILSGIARLKRLFYAQTVLYKLQLEKEK